MGETIVRAMHKSEIYRCRQEEIWRRQIGDVRPEAFSRKIGGCQVFDLASPSGFLS